MKWVKNGSLSILVFSLLHTLASSKAIPLVKKRNALYESPNFAVSGSGGGGGGGFYSNSPGGSFGGGSPGFGSSPGGSFGSSPGGSFPGSSPGGSSPGGSSPGGSFPGSSPGGSSPGGSSPGGSSPGGSSPGGSSPGGSSPGGSSPGGSSPGSSYPGSSYPGSSYPGGSSPGDSPGLSIPPGGTQDTPGPTPSAVTVVAPQPTATEITVVAPQPTASEITVVAPQPTQQPSASEITVVAPKPTATCNPGGYRPINQAAVDLMKRYEHFEPNPYNTDGAHKWTVGYGHLCGGGADPTCAGTGYTYPMTEPQASELFERDVVVRSPCVLVEITTHPTYKALKQYEACLAKYLNDNITLNDNQYGALVSWVYNEGCGTKVSRSTLITHLNEGQDPNTVASEELPKWKYAEGKVLNGLVSRRADEVNLFKTASSNPGLPC